MGVRSQIGHFRRLLSDPGYRSLREDYKAFRRAHGRGMTGGYPGLLPGHLVLDIGGGVVDWATIMADRYAVAVHVFEPDAKRASKLVKRYKKREDISVHDWTSPRKMFDMFADEQIAVAKMNLGGGEYDLLPELVETGLISRVDRLAVKFSNNGPADAERRDQIRAQLSKTHDCMWYYPFIWEAWHRKGLGV